MKKYTTLVFCLVSLLFVGCQSDPAQHVGVASIEPTSCGNVKNMHQVGDLYVAGGVTPSDYPLLKELGIKTILSLRLDPETPDMDEDKLIAAQGMTYVRVPWSGGPDELTADKLDAMRKVLRQADRPMLFHCGSANRVSAGWLAYRVLDEGVYLDTAIAEAKTFGLRNPAYETIVRNYIREQQAR